MYESDISISDILLCFYYQEMYDKTQLSRGEGLDPNPLAPGEYIEHHYRLVTCNHGMQVFPVLNVRKIGSILFHFYRLGVWTGE